RVPGHASDLGGPAHGAGAVGRTRGAGPDADAVYQRAPRGAPARRGAGAGWGGRDVRAAGPDPPAIGEAGAAGRPRGGGAPAPPPAARRPPGPAAPSGGGAPRRPAP